MRWQGMTYRDRIARRYRWHRVFAWLPCQTITGEVIWLEPVLRRLIRDGSGPQMWQYKAPCDQLSVGQVSGDKVPPKE